jgi:hypothetical protein
MLNGLLAKVLAHGLVLLLLMMLVLKLPAFRPKER